MVWKKGESGNPDGRPRNTGKVAKLRELLEPDAPELVEKAKSLALEGDGTMMRLCLERLVPPVKTRDEPVEIPGLKEATTLKEKGDAIIAALADGHIGPSEAAALMGMVGAQARVIEVDDIERRLAALENASK